MHELPVIKQIFAIVLNYAKENNAKEVRSVTIQIGEMRDLVPEYVEKYFKYVSEGTIAENAVVKIDRPPVICRCNECGETFSWDAHDLINIKCPTCGSDEGFTPLTGNELQILEIEIV